MRLYLDQMLRIELAALLRDAGQTRADDALVLERAVREERILVTLDEHFGDWVVLPLSKHFGVIRVKAHPTSTENVAKILIPLLANRSQSDFRNRLVIVSLSGARWIQTSNE